MNDDYKDGASELLTEEAKRAFCIRVEEIQTRTKAEIENALAEIKEAEKRKIAQDRAEDIARRLQAYKDAGLPDDLAWELVKQEAMMVQYYSARC